VHASTLTFSAPARRTGRAVAATAGSPPEAANDTTRSAAPSVPTHRVVRLTLEEQRRELQRTEVRAWMARLFAPVLGLVLFGLLWQLIAHTSGQLPTPAKVWQAAVTIFSDPFYQKGPNDQGIGWNVLSSLKRVGVGFGLAAIVGIPLGFVIGRFPFFNQMAAPLISLLKPVSPLAWLPIGLLLFKAANPAAIWTIFICSLWPMIINTAVGVRQIPQEYLDVAKVLQLSEWKVLTRILFPAVLPFMLTGVRLSIGIAWLVIVAAEMLTGGVGIGFWVWDEWNNLNVQHIIIAIIVIGVVGLLLEASLILIARRFEYQ
jgi:nitrate/nitrite transport system permease protein